MMAVASWTASMPDVCAVLDVTKTQTSVLVHPVVREFQEGEQKVARLLQQDLVLAPASETHVCCTDETKARVPRLRLPQEGLQDESSPWGQRLDREVRLCMPASQVPCHPGRSACTRQHHDKHM